jgi:hypothetical protein
MSLHLWIIPLLPLTGAAINGLLGKRFPKALVNAIALGATAAAFAYALWVAVQFFGLPADQIPHIERYATWMTAGTFTAEYGLYLDQLSLVMLLIVTGGLLDPYLFSGLHGARGRLLPVLLPQPLHVLHADADSGEQLSVDVRWVGRCGPGVVPADWILVPERLGRECGQEGIHC